MSKTVYKNVEIKAVSVRKRGVLIGDKWYDVGDKVNIEKVSKGRARVGFEGDKVVYIKYGGSEEKEEQEAKKEEAKVEEKKAGYWEELQLINKKRLQLEILKNKEVRRLAVLNSAIELWKVFAGVTGQPPEIKDVIDTAEIFEKWVLGENVKDAIKEVREDDRD